MSPLEQAFTDAIDVGKIPLEANHSIVASFFSPFPTAMVAPPDVGNFPRLSIILRMSRYL